MSEGSSNRGNAFGLCLSQGDVLRKVARKRMEAEKKCWSAAAELYHATLKPNSKKRIDQNHISPNQYVEDLRELAQSTHSLYEKRDEGCKSVLLKLQSLIKAVHRFAPVVDSFVQNQPHITALVWGSIRFLIQVASAEIEVAEEISQALASIVHQIGRYEKAARLFAEDDRVTDAIARLFAHILRYLVRAKLHYSKGKVLRAKEAAFSNKFTEILDKLHKCELNLDREIGTAIVGILLGNQQASRTQALLCSLEFAKQEAFRNELRDSCSRNSNAALNLKAFLEKILAAQELLLTDQEETQKMLAELFDTSCYVLRYQERNSAIQERQELHSALRWLSKDLTIFSDIATPAKGTCEWLINSPQYQDWQNSGFSGPFWLHGKPGCGKSVLAAYHANNNGSEFTLRHFFRYSAAPYSTNAVSLVASLTLQLCQNDALAANPVFSCVIEKISRLSIASLSAVECRLEKLLAILDELLELLPTFTVVVDALDECANLEETSSTLFCYLRGLASRSKARVILFSRPNSTLEEYFGNSHHIAVDCTVICPNILRFVEQEIEKTPKLQSLKAEILTKVSAQCQGMFLWAQLFVNDLKRSRSPKERRASLSGYPSGLFAVYDQELKENRARLSEDELSDRSKIFYLLLGAVTPLTAQEISNTFALGSNTESDNEDYEFDNPVLEVLRLTQPLAMISDGGVQFIHATARDYLIDRGYSNEESNAFLALKSLNKLTQGQYQSWKYASNLLRKNLLAGSIVGESLGRTFKESVFYNYACLNWQVHVTALSAPSEAMLTKLAQFLDGTEFVTWSEVLFELKSRIGLGPQIQVYTRLLSWYKQRSEKTKARIPIQGYFVTSHEKLSKELKDCAEDVILPYLPLLRLGQYFNIGAHSHSELYKAYEYKKEVAEGFCKYLGARSPFTLRARTSLLQEYFTQLRFDEAEKELAEVAQIQLEVVGEDVADYFVTLQLLGLAQYCVTKFQRAAFTLTSSADGLRKLLGETAPLLLMTELYKAYALERQANLADAQVLYESIWERWEPIQGAKHPLSLMVQTALGSVYRKLHEYEQSEKCLLEAWTAREALWSINVNVAVDSAIQLCVLYRDTARGKKAIEVLDVISRSEVFTSDFERTCQAKHIRALVQFDSGNFNRPRIALQRLLDEATGTHRDKNNRELLWVRTTLADVLRQHDDSDEALMLFSDLVEKKPNPDADVPRPPSSLDGEPESRHQLIIAEKALRLVKQAEFDKAATLLQENNLQWSRERDFFVVQGGPITDTATLQAPRIYDGSE